MIHRNGQGVQGVYRGDPIFAFHHINAHEQGDQIVLDLAAYDDKSIIDAFYLDQLRDESGTIPLAKLSRFCLSLNGSVSREALMDLPLELPRINYRACNMRHYEFVYGVSGTGTAKGFYNCLVKADLETGQSQQWSEERCFPGEPVFVAMPNASGEDQGIILSVVLDVNGQKSFLLVLEAHSFKELARAQVPQHIPFGFHGQFYTGASG